MVRARYLGWLCSVVLVAAALQVDAASSATEYLKAHIASLQQVLRDPNLARDLYQRRRLERIILLHLFDFDEMSRRALGQNAVLYEDRLEEFTPLFIDFLEHAYMGTLEENGDAEIRYGRETADGDDLWVWTQTTLRDGSEYRVYYRFHLSETGWRAYDVAIESVSLVENYRSQFERFLLRNSFDQLLENLRNKKSTFN